jgi:hypothetical protein
MRPPNLTLLSGGLVPIISQLGLGSEVNQAISACISSGTDVCVCVQRGYRSSSGQRVIRNGTPTRGLCENHMGLPVI